MAFGMRRAVSARWIVPWLLVVALGFTLRATHLGFGLPYRLHPDEGPATNQIVKSLRGPLRLGSYFHPPLLRVVAWLAVRVEQRVDPAVGAALDARVIRTMRVISLVAGTVTVVVVGAVAGWFLSPAWALVAGLLFAVSPIAVFLSKYGTPDSLLVLLFSSALWIAFRLRERPSLWCYALGGLVSGLAIAAKYNGAFVLFAFPVAHLLAPQAQRPNLVRAAVAFTSGLLVALAVGFPLLPWEWEEFVRTTGLEAHHQFVRGHRGIKIRPLDYYFGFHFVRSIWPSTGAPLFVAILGGLVLWLLRAESSKYIVWAVAVPYYVAMESVLKLTFSPERYVFPLLPLYAIAASVFCAALAEWSSEREPTRWWVGAALAIAVLIWPAYRSLRLVQDIEPDTRIRAREWLLEHVDRDARVAIGGLRHFYPPLTQSEFPRLTQFGRDEPDYWILSSFDYDEAFTYPEESAAAAAYYLHVIESHDLVFEVAPAYDTFMFHNPTLKVFRRRAPRATDG